MGVFKFRLQKVLDLRLWREEEKARLLGEAQRRAAEAEKVLSALRSALAASRDRLAETHGAGGPVGRLQNLTFVLGQLDARIAEADAARREAEAGVESSRTEYAEALRERRVLEQLRERQREADRSKAARAERKAMDDIAISRHGRTAVQPEGGSA